MQRIVQCEDLLLSILNMVISTAPLSLKENRALNKYSIFTELKRIELIRRFFIGDFGIS